jgi:LCP family protein required for cell wall assembly
MKKQHSSMDGFVPRRSGAILGQTERPLNLPRPEVGRVARQDEDGIQPSRQLARVEIDESLQQIDDEEPISKPKRGLFGRSSGRKNTSGKKKRHYVRTFFILVVLAAVIVAGYVGVKAFLATSSVFQGGILDIFQNQPLKADKNGRSNILVFGTSEDDPGHDAPTLTDSIMIISIDQTKKNAYLISLPRDLYVDYGELCTEGYKGKINSLYQCYSEYGKKESAGADALAKKAGEILGLDVQYHVHVNYTVVRDIVKALDGITVKIESKDPRGVMDSNFDWKCMRGARSVSHATMVKNCPPSGHFIDYPNGEVTLDAEHALYLAQARGDIAPTYGLEQSNFDREKNQQKIVKALKEKAVSAGTLTNIGKVTGLIDALGSNLRTNFETKEIRTLMSLGKDIPTDSILSISLVEEGEVLVTTGNIGGASVVQPVAGQYNYSDIHKYVTKKLNSNDVSREGAHIALFNGSGIVGAAKTQADLLETKSFTISSIENAPAGTYEAIEIYQIGKGMAKTSAKLQEIYKVKIKTTPPPVTVAKDINFVIIIGKDTSSDN